MNRKHILLAALALPLSACMGVGGTGSTFTGISGPVAMAPGPDANSVAVARELRETDRRIDAKRDSGQLSRREVRGLRRGQASVNTMASQYGADGVITDSERSALELRARDLQAQADNAAFISDTQSGSKRKNKPK
tara:strand:+ start:212 stop:619 length:408 start_codon:yes stop_codon:yes gene_type:complete